MLLALVAVPAYGNFMQLLGSWQKIFIDIRLREAGRYMLANLEKDLAYEGRAITLASTGRITAQCIYGGRKYIYTPEGTALYKETETLTTMGKNPLFLPDCAVSGWQARRLGNTILEISFTLAAQGRRQHFRQVMFCVNGRVIDE